MKESGQKKWYQNLTYWLIQYEYDLKQKNNPQMVAVFQTGILAGRQASPSGMLSCHAKKVTSQTKSLVFNLLSA